MATLPPAVTNALNTLGISAFGIGMPVLSPGWTDGTLPTVDEAALALNLASGTWLCPIAGTVRKVEFANPPFVTLTGPDGESVTGPGMLLQLFPQQYLRLSRLYAQLLEAPSPGQTGRDIGLAVRPVPRYFFFAGSPPPGNAGGNVNPGDELTITGDLTIYDERGFPIDPLAVAAAFDALMTAQNILQLRDPFSAPFDPNSQVNSIAALASSSVVHVRLCDHAGQPYDGEHLNGITAVAAAPNIGLFTLDASPGPGSDLSGTITRDASTGNSGTFPNTEARLLVLGPATTGRLGNQFDPPALPPAVTLTRDFFNVRVVQLQPYLLGLPNPNFNGTLAEIQPTIRLNEPLTTLVDGNDILGAADQALSGTPTEALCVAQAIDGNFPAPAAAGVNAHWPAFPPLPGGVTPEAAGALPVNLREAFAPTAQYFDDGDAGTANTDVVFTLNNLPVGAAVRVYHREFVADAREERGDGAGGTVGASGQLSLLLRDPLGLRRPGLSEGEISIPPEATLSCDVLVFKRTGESRIYGNVEAPIIGSTATDPTPAATNPFDTASRRGVSNAGVLGLGNTSLPSIEGLDFLEALQTILVALTGETTPRDAPRLPTMARRDLLVAGLTGGNWHGVISGGRLTAEAHSDLARRGAPGGRGGRETQFVGVATQNGRLAYDIARMAFRRTDNFVERMIDLADTNWDEPAEPAALPAGTPPSDTQGTIAGVLLQTIAPNCESPEISLLQPVVEANLNQIPDTFDDLVDQMVNMVNAGTAGLPTSGTIGTQVSRLQNQVINTLNGLKDNAALDESQRERLYNELRREVAASCYGRRDTQWSLAHAIENARNFIYIESPGFADTQKDYGADPTPPYAVDLIELLTERLDAAPGLHVIICTPKFPDFAPGYEAAIDHEAHNRRMRILGLPAERVVAFHPMGFPGRPSRLESTVVVVDDLWALVGSSTVRRRGLTLDGSSDLVFTDMDLVDGRGNTIMNFRRRLLATRLGITASETNSFGTIPNANFVQLRDGVESFYAVRDMLLGDGLGKIMRLWNGRTPGLPPPDPDAISMELANPEGLEFNLLGTLALAVIGGEDRQNRG